MITVIMFNFGNKFHLLPLSCLMMALTLLGLIIPRLQNDNATDDGDVDLRSFRKSLLSKLGKLM